LKSHEPILAAIDPLDLKLLPWFNAILLPDFGGKHDLPFGG
jgi:hypothetical protein